MNVLPSLVSMSMVCFVVASATLSSQQLELDDIKILAFAVSWQNLQNNIFLEKYQQKSIWRKHFSKLDCLKKKEKKKVELKSLKLEFQDFSQGTRVLYKWNSSFLDLSSMFFFVFLVHVRLHPRGNGQFQKQSNLLKCFIRMLCSKIFSKKLLFGKFCPISLLKVFGLLFFLVEPLAKDHIANLLFLIFFLLFNFFFLLSA